MADLADSTWAPLLVLGAYLGGGLIAFPLIVLIAATAAAFGPILGFAYGLDREHRQRRSHVRGRCLARDAALCRACSVRGSIAFARPSIDRGIAAIAAIRLVPVAPFTVVNMVAGACHIRLVDYVLGTILGLLPGLLLMSALGYQVFRFMAEPSLIDFLLVAGGAVVWVAVVVIAQRVASKVASRSP